MTEHNLSEGDVVYDSAFDKEKEVAEVKADGSVVWDDGMTEGEASVASNLAADDQYELR